MQKRVQITTWLSGFSHTKCTLAISTQIKRRSMLRSASLALSWGNHYPDCYL